MNCLQPEALQRAQVINISQFIPQLFEDFPVPVARRDSIFLFQMLLKIALHAIIVDERIIDVEKEDDIDWV